MKNRIRYFSLIVALSITCMLASFGAVEVAFAIEGADTGEPEVTEPGGSDPEKTGEPEVTELTTPVIVLDNDQITADEIGDILVEGTVSIGLGQEVGVFDADGDECFGTTTVGKSGEEETFTILISSESLHYGDNSFTVRSLPVEDVLNGSDPVAVTITIPKKNQTITADDITFKEGGSANINASVDTDLPLTYVSSKPAIATVNASGTLVGKRGGKTQVTVRQVGNDEYNPASIKITVTVIPTTFRIAFDPAGGEGTVTEQAVKPGQRVHLKANKFKREGYKFMGWATASGKPVTTNPDVTKFKNVNMKHFQLGKVKYKNKASVKDLAKVGKTVKLYAVWKGTGPAAAADWSRLVARDNKFGYNLFGGHLGKKYGKKHRAGKKKNKFGCYFCKTNTMSNKYCWRGGKSYVCMTFVNAAYAHGANCKTFWKKNKTCRVLYINGKADIPRVKKKCKALKLIGHPTVTKAKKGDILIKQNWHVMMYIGKIKNKYYISEASTETGIQIAGFSEVTMNKIFKEYTVFRLK